MSTVYSYRSKGQLFATVTGVISGVFGFVCVALVVLRVTDAPLLAPGIFCLFLGVNSTLQLLSYFNEKVVVTEDRILFTDMLGRTRSILLTDIVDLRYLQPTTVKVIAKSGTFKFNSAIEGFGGLVQMLESQVRGQRAFMPDPKLAPENPREERTYPLRSTIGIWSPAGLLIVTLTAMGLTMFMGANSEDRSYYIGVAAIVGVIGFGTVAILAWVANTRRIVVSPKEISLYGGAGLVSSTSLDKAQSVHRHVSEDRQQWILETTGDPFALGSAVECETAAAHVEALLKQRGTS